MYKHYIMFLWRLHIASWRDEWYNVRKNTGGNNMEEKYNKIKYNNQFNAQNYDRINYTVEKGKREIIKAAAERRGMSTNAYINAAVDAALAKDAETLQ